MKRQAARGWLLFGILLAGLVLMHRGTSGGEGAAAAISSAYTLVLGLCLILLGASLGKGALGWFPQAADLDALERVVFSFAGGMGILGLGIYGLGVVGLFQPGWMLVLLILTGVACGRWVVPLFQDVRQAVAVTRDDWGRARVGRYLVIGLVAAIALLTLLHALAPPWAYDGLVYHLQAPKLFLEQGRVTPLPSILQANGPLLVQMLYGIGLAFGSDTLSQVLHWAYAWFLVLALLAAGRRLLSPPGGWLAAGILLGIPIFPLWGTLAYVDMPQAIYEFLAVWAILRWRNDPRRSWLILSALMAGLALGTKQSALFMAPALCLWLVLLARRSGWLAAIRLGLGYGLVIGLVAAPWYIFNLVSLGDPFFPFLQGGAEWPAARVALLLDYLRSFGTGRSPVDLLLLPWNIYFRHDAFAAFMSSIEYPSFLFPLALLVPIVAVSPGVRPLAWFTLLRIAAWYLGSQQTRFLLPLYPVGCLMTAAVLLALESRLRRRPAPPRLSAAIIAGLVAATLAYSVIYTLDQRPLGVVLGVESKESFLRREVYDYNALNFIRSVLPAEARVMELWDGQGYYCDDRCLADAGQVQAPYLHQKAPTVEAMETLLAARGVTHLLLDLEGLNFLLLHDPQGTHASAAEFFLNDFIPRCGETVFQDDFVRLYRVACPTGGIAPAR